MVPVGPLDDMTRVLIRNGISIGSAVFVQLTAMSLYFTMSHSSLQNCPFPSNIWFPGPTRVLNPNGISSVSAVFAGLSTVTDRLTDLLGLSQ